MILPDYVLQCLEALEQAGYPAYAVGGCVRDACLGITPHDYDVCTAALPEQTEAVFAANRLVLAGKKHGTVGVVTDFGVVEITTFRTDGEYRDNRHPDKVEFVDDITRDLARRDFTVNAMAYSPKRGFADPFGGQKDLKDKVLRAVGDPVLRFQEDSLRILRGVRFAVRYCLNVDAQTKAAMLSQAPLMDNLARERVFDELCKLLLLVTAEDLKRFAPVLTQVVPELAPLVDFDQHSPHHAYDLYTHVAHVVEGVPQVLPLRWAALLHDVGKIPTFTRDETGRGHFYGHAGASAELADKILRRLKAPTALREQVVLLVDRHMTRLEPEKKQLKRWLGRLGWENVEYLLALQEADLGSKGTGHTGQEGQFEEIRSVLAQIRQENSCLTLKDLAVNGNDLMERGYAGKAIGETLKRLLDMVLEEQVENTRPALLKLVETEFLQA